MSAKPAKTSRRDAIKLSAAALAGAAMLPGSRIASAQATQPASSQASSWPQRRKDIARRWLDLLGQPPTEILPLEPVIKEAARDGNITRYHVSFQVEPDDRMTAWLLVPDSAKLKPAPAIICIHSTTWGAGKDSTAGLAGRRKGEPPEDEPYLGRGNGLLLAQHGYVTLCLDMLTDGERVKPGQRVMDTRDFYQRHPEWSMIGKNNWDISRSIDFLQTLDFVDGKQIGCTGWSLGGHQCVFAAAFDERITATVANGGVLDWHRPAEAWSRKPESWTPWKEGDPPTNNPELERRFRFKTNSGPYIYIKKFRPYLDDPKMPVPVDFDELMMMVAPRPLLVISSEWEFYSHKLPPKCLNVAKVYADWRDVDGLPSVMEGRQQRLGYDRTLEYYEFNNKLKPERVARDLTQIGAGDCFGWFSFPGGHSYPPAARLVSFGWFDRWLGHVPPSAA
ncbi:MAG: alpha/beta hydrolase family protein [Tepidisphaeraceae bacterium]